VPPTLPPYALAVPSFPLRALAALAGRAPLGGEREVALAAFMAARLAQELLSARPLAPAARATRVVAARGWLASLALPAGTRIPLARLIDACAAGGAGEEGRGSPEEAAAAIGLLLPAAGPLLDPPSRAELELLARALTPDRGGTGEDELPSSSVA
jgi:hypothetical protein